MASARLLVAVGAEGGSIAVYADTSDPARARYKVLLVDQTPSFLNEDESGPVIQHDSGWLPTWTAAIESLSRYPWPHLVGSYFNTAAAGDVWHALQDYAAGTGRPIGASALNRWREACGQPER
jgi:hypothetical protein